MTGSPGAGGSTNGASGGGRDRGQATLVALAAALVVLTATLGVALALADGALADEKRDAGERRAAVAATDRLVAADASTTRRANVLDAAALSNLTAADVDALAPPVEGTDVRVRLGNETLVSRGQPRGGTTFRRLVLRAERTDRRLAVNASEGVTLPRRTGELRLSFVNASVETVRANGRVLLHRPGGLDGSVRGSVRRAETIRLTFDDDATGTVELTYYPENTAKATLEVTVDA